MDEKLLAFERRLEALDRQMMDPAVASDGRRYREVSQEASHVRHIVDTWRAAARFEDELVEAQELAGDEDPEVRELAKMEVESLQEQASDARAALRLLLLPRDPYEGRPLMLEIRAGTGGDEAALFAADLFRMYSRFGEANGLRVEAMSTSPITVGGGSGKTLQGLREVVAAVTGEHAYSLLKFEAGVHRVQRVPATETQGRIHTSAATVAVLPEPDEVEVKIEAGDLDIQTMRAGGPGGQSVNTTDSAVRIVHLPTKITVQCQDEKSQHKNREKAMRVLKARLLEKLQGEQHAEESAARKAMVGSGDRSERIRTYNYPQNRVTDHRINLTLYKLESVVSGDLSPFVEALTAAWQTEQLAQQDLT